MDFHSRRITAILENALREDSAIRDATTYACVDADQRAAGTILAKQDCILSGLGAVARIFDVFAQLDGTVVSYAEVTSHPEIFDGVRLHRGQQVAVVRHNARILDTRKTVPGLRVLDKYAVRCGGGLNHRLDLSGGVLVKNNHIAVAGGIAPALERAHKNRRGAQPIEVEVQSLQQLEEALQHGAEAVLLDNMTPETVAQCVERVQSHSRRIPLECSGGINLENVRSYAETGVDYISIGLLTHSPQAVDMSLRVTPV